jgi:hypothetical protein
MPASSGSKRKPKEIGNKCFAGFFLGLMFDPGDGGFTSLRNVGRLVSDCKAFNPENTAFNGSSAITAD